MPEIWCPLPNAGELGDGGVRADFEAGCTWNQSHLRVGHRGGGPRNGCGRLGHVVDKYFT